MLIRDISKINRPDNADELRELLESFTIFEKLEFSGFTKAQLHEKIQQLKFKVSNRDVLLEMDDRAVLEYWFKNWLHCDLKHFAKKPYYPTKAEFSHMTEDARRRDMHMAMLHFYENGQQNYTYTIDDIEKYVASISLLNNED